MLDKCIVCALTIRKKQQAIQCDECAIWTHRTCQTGISQDEYREAMKTNFKIPFICQSCEHEQETTDQHGVTYVIHTSSDASEMETEMSIGDSCHDQPQGSTTNLNDGFIQPSDNDSPILYNQESAQSLQPEEECISSSVFENEQESVQYEVFPEGSQQGKPLLVSSDGFRYSVKKHQKKSVLWRCSTRSVKVKCLATVIQRGNEFIRGQNVHQHGPEVSLHEKIRLNVKVKSHASCNPYKSATDIVKEVQDSVLVSSQSGLPTTSSLARKANRYRRTLRDRKSTSKVRPSVKAVTVQDKIYALWDQFNANKIDTMELLDKCADVYLPQLEQQWFLGGSRKPSSNKEGTLVTKL